MFCGRCGQQIPDASEICPLCGRETTIKLEPQPVFSAPAVAAYPAVPAFSVPRTNLQGIGGWLLFFCIYAAILTPLGSLASISVALVSRWSLYYLALGMFSLIVGISVWRVSPHALLLVKTYFISLALWEALRIAYVVLTHPQFGVDTPMLFRVRTLIWVVIWAAYFHESKRVRATFGRNL